MEKMAITDENKCLEGMDEKEKCIAELHKKRNLTGSVLVIATTVAVAASLFHLYTAYGGQLFALTQRAIHLALICFLGFLYFPSSVRYKNRVTLSDGFFALLSVGLCIYLIMSINQLVYRAGEPIFTDWFFGIVMVLLVLELTRRVVGNARAMRAGAFLL